MGFAKVSLRLYYYLSYFIFSYSAIFAASVIKHSVQFSSVQFKGAYARDVSGLKEFVTQAP